MKTAVVIPVGPGRLENLQAVLNCLAFQTVKPDLLALVCDGPEARFEMDGVLPFPVAVLQADKHEPGGEQPRNLGVNLVRDLDAKQSIGVTHVWFLDTDVIVGEDCLEMYNDAMQAEPIDRILVGPYDWMMPGQREAQPDLYNDPRWASFREHEPWEMLTNDLSAGLACFSGNLVWPIGEFERVGGFWNELHHGRCEDGELGLRAVSMQVPISYVREARGWHLWHEVNVEVIEQRNARDVPMLNNRHPWVQGEGVFMEDADGKRFSVRCPNCSQEFPSAEIWAHKAGCKAE
jgi:GT2 family glycosyltransferase